MNRLQKYYQKELKKKKVKEDLDQIEFEKVKAKNIKEMETMFKSFFTKTVKLCKESGIDITFEIYSNNINDKCNVCFRLKEKGHSFFSPTLNIDGFFVFGEHSHVLKDKTDEKRKSDIENELIMFLGDNFFGEKTK